MLDSTPQTDPLRDTHLFISYRRDDAPGHAGRLHDELSRRFGQAQVFMDLDMEPGVDFVDQIDEAVGSCRLLIALIGPRWMTARDEHGQLRLDDPADFVRAEIQAALTRPDVRVIPTLVQGARMPAADELALPLAGLARRNAIELSEARWSYDVERLASAIEAVLGEGPALAPPERFHGAEPAGTGRGRSERPGRDRVATAIRPTYRRRLAVAAVAGAILAGVGAATFASGSDRSDVAPPPSGSLTTAQARLLDAVPAAVRTAGCKRSEDHEFWMGRAYTAVLQEECQLPPAVLTDGVVGGNVTYGVFRSVDAARAMVDGDYRYELQQDAKNPERCGGALTAQLEADHPGGDARCYTNDEGVFISWLDPRSAVGAHLYFDHGSSLEAAVAARAKLL